MEKIMNKVKLLGVSVAVLILLAGGAAYNAQKNMEQREAKIVTGFNDLNKSIPSKVKQENKIEKSLFSSTGVYSVSYSEEGKTDGFVLNYKLDHGIASWFGGDIKFESTLAMQGEITKYIKSSNPSLLQMTGNIKEDGTFNLVGTGSKIIIDEEKENLFLTLEPSTFFINYNQSSKNLKSEMTFPLINVNSKNNISTLKSLKLGRDFNIAYPELGNFSINLGEINDKNFNIKNINLLADSVLNKEKIDMKVALGAKSISIIPIAQKDIEVDMVYSLKGVDKVALELYRDFYNKPNKVTEEEIIKYKNKFKQILKSGLLVSLDKFMVKNPKGSINFSAFAKIIPSTTIDLQKNTALTLKVLMDGEFAQMLTSFVTEDKKQFLTFDDKNNIKSEISYENNVTKLNGQTIPEEAMNPMAVFLTGLDNELKN